MSKNVKMLFALLATAAIMVGVSFADDSHDLHNIGELVSGDANFTYFELDDRDSTVFELSADSKDEYILHNVSGDYNEHVSLDVDNVNITLAEGASSDKPLLKPVSMSITVFDDEPGWISGDILMCKPLYGEKSPDAAPLSADITLDSIAYVNSGDADAGYMFCGNASYDVKVNLIDTVLSVRQLVQKNAGYSFSVAGDSIILASLDGVEKLTAKPGTMFSDKKITELLEDDDTVYAVYDKNLMLYVVRGRSSSSSGCNAGFAALALLALAFVPSKKNK